MKRYYLLTAVVILAAASVPASAQEDRLEGRELPAAIEGLKLEQPLTITGINPLLGRNVAAAEGRQQIIVRLKGAPVARGGYKLDIEQEQALFLQRCQALPSARFIAQVHMVLNAVFLEIDAADLQAIANDPAVQTIKQVTNYEMDLSETVPYIGASTVQSLGVDGKGISVAVLDSGVDYTHAAFGGAGTLAAYEAAYGTDVGPFGGDPRHTVLDGQFPSGHLT